MKPTAGNTDASAEGSLRPVNELGGAKSPHRILVVEDDNDLRRLNTEVLRHRGYHVDAAEDGVLAWKRLGAHNYDLMITDNKMPNMTGVELLNKLHGCGLGLPTLMVTSEVPWDEFQKHPWIEPADVLSKPYTIRQLVEKVRKILGINSLRAVISPT